MGQSGRFGLALKERGPWASMKGKLMKLLAVTAAVLGLCALSSPALADPTAGPGATTVPVLVVFGRATRPSVQIFLPPPSAAADALAAHKALLARRLDGAEPPSLRPAR